jgi:hypothetical protein
MEVEKNNVDGGPAQLCGLRNGSSETTFAASAEKTAEVAVSDASRPTAQNGHNLVLQRENLVWTHESFV